MLEAASTLGAFAVLLAGFALMALSQDRHWGRVSHAPASGSRARLSLRLAGLLLVQAALLPCVYGQGVAFGTLLWVVLLSLAAASIALALTWRAHWFVPLAWLLLWMQAHTMRTFALLTSCGTLLGAVWFR